MVDIVNFDEWNFPDPLLSDADFVNLTDVTRSVQLSCYQSPNQLKGEGILPTSVRVRELQFGTNDVYMTI